MNARTIALVACGTAAMTMGPTARAQAGAQPAAPAVGQFAPDFSIPGATRYGRLAAPVRLADYRGKTVVIAFFFKARTKG